MLHNVRKEKKIDTINSIMYNDPARVYKMCRHYGQVYCSCPTTQTFVKINFFSLPETKHTSFAIFAIIKWEPTTVPCNCDTDFYFRIFISLYGITLYFFMYLRFLQFCPIYVCPDVLPLVYLYMCNTLYCCVYFLLYHSVLVEE